MLKRFAHSIGFRAPRKHRVRERGECGSAIMETAVSMIILLTILFGIIEVCLALYTYHFISEAAREGTRFAIVRGNACQAPGYECNATSAQIQTYLQGLGFPGIDSTLLKATATWPDTGGNSPGNRVQVTVTYKFPMTIPFVSARKINMSSTSAMVISQ